MILRKYAHIYVQFIYYLQDIEIAKNKTRERHLDIEVEKDRLLEIDEHYKRIKEDEKLRNMFDYILYNNYDNSSKNEIISLVKKLMLEEK